MRPDELATDTASSEGALLHFAENVDFDRLVFVQPTSPLLTSGHINDGLDTMKRENLDSIFSSVKHHWIPPWRLESKSWMPARSWDINNRPRRQDFLILTHLENGAFYITSRELLLKNKIRVSGKVGIYEMYPSESFQVDTYDDLIIIKALIGSRKK